MTEPILLVFAPQLEEACDSIENSAGQIVDALRWRACLKHGFPTLNPSAKTKDTAWTIRGKYYGETPISAVDAILRAEYASDPR